MIRAALIPLGVVLAAGAAPMQCASAHPAELQHEETPGEALWNLAERFAAENNPTARRATLAYLVERYPSSRFAERARDALRDAP